MTRIFYARVDEFWRKEQKLRFLMEKETVGGVDWTEIHPDAKETWLTEGLRDDFESLTPLGTKDAKEGTDDSPRTIFKNYSRGAETTRDDWVYNFDSQRLMENVSRLIETYNTEVDRWRNRADKSASLDDFVVYDDRRIKWSSRLKECLKAGQKAVFDPSKVRRAMYRPFCGQHLFFDEILVHRRGQFHRIFPDLSTEDKNLIVCVPGIGNRKDFGIFVLNKITALDFAFEKVQCFPFYTYDEDGTNRRENVTDWALDRFRERYAGTEMDKWDVFHYVYAVLHHPDYRTKYAANLKRELPRIPFAPDFRGFVEAGKRLAELHVHYEKQKEHPLETVENPEVPFDLRVEKMKLSKDRTKLVYNDFLTLEGIPPKTFDYRLGNRSALEWVIDQYQVTTDKRSGIVNNPNRDDDEGYILRLIKQIVTVSLETVRIVGDLPALA